jgi:NADP-dependent 3-hydroxy acid dehydrogenase YdfG
MKRRELKGAVVVLTGASSGIGRAAALHFARRGAKLVLAARDGAALEDVALEQFGKVDVWVNDAAVYMMGALEACPSHAIRELFETNVMGVLHGTRAALACFRICEGKGVIINIGSVAGKIAYADAGPYCASKHAVHAITEALRQELVDTEIEACLVVPATVDTPLYQHSANYTGREVLAMRPIYDATRVAAAIVRCAERPRREIRVGAAPALITLMARVIPWVYERMQPRMVEKDHLGKLGAGPTSGNFNDPRETHQVDGGWRARRSPGKKMMNGVRTGALPILTSGG